MWEISTQSLQVAGIFIRARLQKIGIKIKPPALWARAFMPEYLDRFLKLANLQRRETGVANNHSPQSPSESVILAESLHDWAGRPECIGAFAYYLDNRIEAAEAERLANVDSHALSALWEGQVTVLKSIKADFAKWRGQPASTGPLNRKEG